MNTYSNWLIYSGRKGAKIEATSYKPILKNEDREYDSFEKARLHELREWSYDFFQNNSIKNINWSNELVEPTNEENAIKNGYESKRVDLVLKTVKVKKNEKVVEFIDHLSKKYALFLQAPPVLQTGDVIKLRCVDVQFASEGRIISLTEFSSCLIIPENFLDSALYNKNAKISPMIKTPGKHTPLRSGKATPLTTKRVASVTYPFLEDYDYEDYLVENPELKKYHGVQSRQSKQQFLIISHLNQEAVQPQGTNFNG